MLNILIAGVGGQGTLLASKILGNYAILKGYDCKISEVHGMAQRGGSVVTYVRMGEKIYSPVLNAGEADVLLAFEQLEALRYSGVVKTGGTVLYSSQQIMPMPVIMGAVKYPENIGLLIENGIEIDAASLAENAGNIKAANTVMMGALTKLLNLDYDLMEKAMEMSLNERVIPVNLKALKYGYDVEINKTLTK